ncbi:MAG TPA: Rne/Rng family ribonuclease [bacterium]|nr:Rne/Rng family ribonuclease [bacterium]HQO34426.1 Rne/Rng family ribonuclease [bacterium]HQQ00479.1 Rne/Rng family ribonuclease [bacterium]
MKAERRIFVSCDDYETRVAIFENSKLAEYFFERKTQERNQGNIYKGRVTTIVPGIEAAFVDIGLARNAFLYVNDLCLAREDFGDLSEDPEIMAEEEESEEPDLPPATISDLLKEGQEILVQLYKEPIGAKGCRVTTNVSLAGRYTVLLPNSAHVGVSRKIEAEEERERLRHFAEQIGPAGMGLIVRTAARGLSETELRTDIESLVNRWKEIHQRNEHCHAPMLIYRSPGLLARLVRDYLDDDFIEMVVEGEEVFDEILRYVQEFAPEFLPHITLYDDEDPLFISAAIEAEISALRSRRIWLPCGGHIVIDETEALTTIDVNTGRYVGKRNLEETVYRTNMEAAAEIARQIRLRDIGGIIIIDFIDMRIPGNREQVTQRLTECLRRDHSRTNIFELTELGLLQMTRKRVRKSLNKTISQPCPYCKREGSILSTESMTIKTLRTVEEVCRAGCDGPVKLRVHPRVAEQIEERFQEQIGRLEERYGVHIEIRPDRELHFEQIVEDHVL